MAQSHAVILGGTGLHTHKGKTCPTQKLNHCNGPKTNSTRRSSKCHYQDRRMGGGVYRVASANLLGIKKIRIEKRKEKGGSYMFIRL